MKRNGFLIVAGALALPMVLAAQASATTFCVPNNFAGCPAGATIQANLQTAMQTNGNDGVADTIHVGPTTVTDPDSFEPGPGNDDLLIRGAGPDQTRLTTSSTSNIFVVNLAFGGNGHEITIEDLEIELPPSLPDVLGTGAGLQMSGDVLDNVDIVVRNEGGSDAIPSWVGGGTFRNGEIRAEGAGVLGTAIRVADTSTGSVVVENATRAPTSTSRPSFRHPSTRRRPIRRPRRRRLTPARARSWRRGRRSSASLRAKRGRASSASSIRASSRPARRRAS